MLRRVALVLCGLALLGLGGVAGFGLRSVTEDTTTTTETIDTVTETATGSAGRTDLPAAVEATRRTLLTAAATGDYEALRKLIPQSGFEYTFGGPVEGGPIRYWQELERTTDERPLTTLVAILRMPYTLSRGIYVWPFAYTLTRLDELTPHERSLLAPLGDLSRLFVPGTGYLGWRAGIEPDGTWVFFVAGD